MFIRGPYVYDVQLFPILINEVISIIMNIYCLLQLSIAYAAAYRPRSRAQLVMLSNTTGN